MKIYIDEFCKCHTENPDGAFREFEVPQFLAFTPTCTLTKSINSR